MKLVFANQNTVLADDNGLMNQVTIDAVYSSDSPLVRLHPWAFDEHPHRVNGVPYTHVEAATAAPGERRGRVG